LNQYDLAETYDWNYENAPKQLPELAIPEAGGQWDFCGLPIGAPLGIPAGPLLNCDWVLYYSRLGFDVLTYKTVRSRYRKCYDLPNLLPVASPQLEVGAGEVLVVDSGGPPRSWAISFGMPSKDPPQWRADVERARVGLQSHQVLVVSVVASPEPDWTLAEISAAMRGALSGLPLVLKIGLFEHPVAASAFIQAVRPNCAALSTVNSVSAAIRDSSGQILFDGNIRGIGGECVRDRCQAEAAMLASLMQTHAPDLKLVGVGGLGDADSVKQRLAAGAHHVQIATAAMLDPLVGIKIRRQLT